MEEYSPMKYAIIDIEASGGSPKRDRVMDIAVFIHDGTQIIDQFATLVNPDAHIPPFITKLTGITNQMVARAPRFADIAKQIAAMTEDAVFVAHNVQFDYLYIRNEFKRLGLNYMRPKLCTIDLARRVLPGMTSYGLDNLSTELDIPVEDRHRAEGDARATVRLFELLLATDHSQQCLDELLLRTNHNPALPENIPLSSVEQLPEEAGIYQFIDATGKVIYIGKSADIRRRVFQHFTETTEANKLYRMMRRIADVTFVETGSELLASLLEIAEVRRLKPTYNRAQLAKTFRYGIFKQYNHKGYLQIELRRKNRYDPFPPIAHYERETHARLMLDERIDHQQLCQCLCGDAKARTNADTVCTWFNSKLCQGAGIGLERAQDYNRRAEKAIKDLQFAHPNFLIFGEGRTYTEKSVIAVKNGLIYGYGFIDSNTQLTHPADLYDELIPLAPHPEVQKLLLSWLKKHPNDMSIVHNLQK